MNAPLAETKAAELVRKAFNGGSATHAWIAEAESAALAELLTLFSAYAVGGKNGAARKDFELALAKRHPDVFYYPMDGRKTVSVEDVKDLIAQSLKPPTMAGCKAYILNASVISQVQNWQGKLLKVLEEPPKNNYLFIGTTNAGELLDTVKSRAILVKAGEIGFSQIKSYLISKGYGGRASEIAAFLSGGSVERALELIADKDAEKLFFTVLETLSKMTGTKNSLVYASRLAAYREKYKLLLLAMENFFAEAVRVKNGAPLLAEIPQTADIAENYSAEAAVRAVGLVEEAYVKLNSHVNYNMVMDNLILKILEVRYRCPK